jgi:2-polyprenyl-3-methyl-5-hydroxy-6-metoxy-1,4-benzoquinol methylase
MVAAAALGATAAALALAWQIEPVRDWMRAKQAQLRFNWVYTQSRPLFNTEPSALLVEAVQQRTPARALDIAMGQGRNALYLASQGWDVTGFDVSDQGLWAARHTASRRKVRLDARLETILGFEYGQDQWDLVVATYAPVPFHRSDYMARLKNSIRPGGLIVIETFMEQENSAKSRSDGLPVQGELERAFEGFRIHRSEISEGVSEWFPRRAKLIRFVAEKPLPGHPRH